jgi:predicted O-linked N-acetylglucosamine transferase (SPINDLY family)
MAWHNDLDDAIRLHMSGRLRDAALKYHEILTKDDKNHEAIHLLGVIAAQEGRHGEAVQYISKAIALNRSNPNYFLNRGNAYNELDDHRNAIQDYDQAISLKPSYVNAHANKALALKKSGQIAQAIEVFNTTLALDNNYAEAHYNLGILHFEMRALVLAINCFQRAALLEPQNADIFFNLAIALRQNGHTREATSAFDHTLMLQPHRTEAYFGRGMAQHELKQFPLAIADFEKVIQLAPDFPYAYGRLLHAKMSICDWRDFKQTQASIATAVQQGRRIAEPFAWQATGHTADSLLNCNKIYAQDKFTSTARLSSYPRATNNRKIRLGYVSGEFGDQATSHLLISLLENHDRTKFEVYCFDNGDDDHSLMRRRLLSAIDALIPIRNMNDADAAQIINEKEIDILFNLNVYFGNQRNGIFAQKPSPIQVNYLGFPGSAGADYMDYIVADKTVIPTDEKRYYQEKVIYLPNSYQPSDISRQQHTDCGGRSDHGLPEESFVFCCFNNNYKITPDIFDIWTEILKSSPNGVLWLLSDSEHAKQNLRKEARIRGLDPDRLIFADRVDNARHLARHRHADLFLDTLPCNAHTTASDALWTGLPVLTCYGTTFPGRVAASLLKALNLPELVTHSLQEYRLKAIELANDRVSLLHLRDRLMEQRKTAPLFDAKLYARHFEKLIAKAYDNYLDGRACEDIEI